MYLFTLHRCLKVGLKGGEDIRNKRSGYRLLERVTPKSNRGIAAISSFVD